MAENLRLDPLAEGVLPDPLREVVRDATTRLADGLAVLRAGRQIDAHEALSDLLYDLRAALNETP